MASLDDLLNVEGVAGEFTADGRLVGYKAKTDLSPKMAQTTAPFCATARMMFNTLAVLLTQLSRIDRVPRQGDRDVFVETARADFNRLFEALVGSR